MDQPKLPHDIWTANNAKAQFLLNWLRRAPPGPAAEIGCVRTPTEVASDGYSTVYLERACEATGREFRSFDASAEAVENANSILEAHKLRPIVQVSDGVAALSKQQPMALLYLDSAAEARHTTAQFRTAAILPGGYIVIDDCQPFDGQQHGKATGVIPIAGSYGGILADLTTTHPGYYGCAIHFPGGKAAE